MNSSPELSATEKMKASLPKSRNLQRSNPLFIFITGLLTTAFVFGGCACGIGLWWFRPIINENADRSREVTQQIVSIQMPSTFIPKGTIDWNVLFVVRLRGVYYERLVGEGQITLIEVNTRLAADEMVRNHVRQTLLEDLPTGSSLIIDPTRTRRETFEVNGEQVVFTLDVASDSRTRDTYRIMEGVFPGNNGQVLLTMRVNSNRWLDEVGEDSDHSLSPDPIPRWVTAMISSIGRPLPDSEFDEILSSPIPSEEQIPESSEIPKDLLIPLAPEIP